MKAGDILFRIDDSDYRARVDQAAAGVATRRAMLGNLASRIDLQQAVIEQAVARCVEQMPTLTVLLAISPGFMN